MSEVVSCEGCKHLNTGGQPALCTRKAFTVPDPTTALPCTEYEERYSIGFDPIKSPSRRTRVYIIGDRPDWVNFRDAAVAYAGLLGRGFNAYCPHLNAAAEMIVPCFTEEIWAKFMLEEWLPWCDVVLDLGGESENCMKERGYAHSLGKTVYTSIWDLDKQECSRRAD